MNFRFQNPPKVHPKTNQNRSSNKYVFFRHVFDKKHCTFKCQNLENINFNKGKPLFLRISLKRRCCCNTFLHQKSFEKGLQHEAETTAKSSRKRTRLVTSIFVAFWLPFWEGFGSQVGTKMDQKVVLEHLLAPFGRFLDALERFLSALARFWLDLGSVWNDLKQFWKDFD